MLPSLFPLRTALVRSLFTLLLPAMLAVLAPSAQAFLLVGDQTSGNVGTYDETTGAVVNATFITGSGNSNGLLALSSRIYVSNNASNRVISLLGRRRVRGWAG